METETYKALLIISLSVWASNALIWFNKIRLFKKEFHAPAPLWAKVIASISTMASLMSVFRLFGGGTWIASYLVVSLWIATGLTVLIATIYTYRFK